MTGRDPRSFDDLAQVFDRYAELVGRPLREYLLSRLTSSRGRAVDLGAGTGQHAALLADHFAEVLAVEISPAMIAYAQAVRPRPNVTYQCRDLRDVSSSRDGQFDLVLSAYTLHHVERLGTTLRGIRELVGPGGAIILIDNVDPRRRVPRSWFVKEAVRGLVGDVLHHRRPVAEAVEVFRLSVHPAWLDHLSTDVFLTPAEFADRYLDVFPGGEITPMYRARALHWVHDPSASDRPFPVNRVARAGGTPLSLAH